MGDYVYEFTGTAPEEFPSLSGVLVHVQGRPNAILEPGDEIELDEPVVHARLEPVSHVAKDAALEHLAESRTDEHRAADEEPDVPAPTAASDTAGITGDRADEPTDDDRQEA